MSEQNEVPPPAAIPVPSFADVNEAAHALLLKIDHVQAHTQPTAFCISGRAMIVNAISQIEAHYAIVAAQQPQTEGQ